MPRSRAFTLSETIIAMFVLVAGMLAVVQLLHSGLRRGTVTERRLLGAVLAEKRMGEIRRWALDAANFASGTAFPNSTTDPDYPDFTIATWGPLQPILSPCSSLETPYGPAPDNLRNLNSSYRKVQVRVSWGSGAGDVVDILSLVGAPRRDLGSITVSAVGTVTPSTPPAGGVIVTATASDGSNIPDVFFQWYLRTRTGSGTVVPTRRTDTARLYDWVRSYTSSGTLAPGNCDLLVRGRSGSNERWSAPTSATMAP